MDAHGTMSRRTTGSCLPSTRGTTAAFASGAPRVLGSTAAPLAQERIHPRDKSAGVFLNNPGRTLLAAVFVVTVGLLARWTTVHWQDPITLLVLGSDARSPSEPGRSDAILVLRADPRQHTVRGVMLPRDLYVAIRGLPIGLTNRINTALFWGDYRHAPGGGLKVARETVSALLRLPLDGVVVLDFPTVSRVVNSIGGVEIYVENLVADRSYSKRSGTWRTKARFGPGWNFLDSRRALEFVRLRRPDSDFGRMARNRQFTEALREALHKPAAWRRLFWSLPQVAASLRSDMSLGRKFHAAWAFYRCTDNPIRWHALTPADVKPFVTEQHAQVLLPVPDSLETAGRFLREGSPLVYAEGPSSKGGATHSNAH